jgi:hypothetical protein
MNDSMNDLETGACLRMPRVPETTSRVGQQLSPSQQAARRQFSHILLTKFNEGIDDRGHALQRNIQSQMPQAQYKAEAKPQKP